MNEGMNPYYQLLEMVKDPSLKAKEIAEKTGYKIGYVYKYRRMYRDHEAWKQEKLRKEQENHLKEQARIDGLIAEAVANEREACAKICADLAAHRDLGVYGMMVAHTCANDILARGR